MFRLPGIIDIFGLERSAVLERNIRRLLTRGIKVSLIKKKSRRAYTTSDPSEHHRPPGARNRYGGTEGRPKRVGDTQIEAEQKGKPIVGIEPTTCRLRVGCSTNGAQRAIRCLMFENSSENI